MVANFDIGKCSEEGPLSALERKLIEEYLTEKGYSLSDLQALPERDARRLMREACNYASLKLAEVESRSQLRKEIHYPS